MKEHIYQAKPGRIFNKSLMTWLLVVVQIVVNVMMIIGLKRPDQIYSIMILNIALGTLTVPAVHLFINYYKYASDKMFIVTYNSLKFFDAKTGKSIELKNSEIEKVIFVQSPNDSKFPWSFHAYFVLIDTAKNMIVVNSYIMDISEFWLDSLARKVSSKKLIREERYFPFIK